MDKLGLVSHGMRSDGPVLCCAGQTNECLILA
jgi:hypothetical protein